MPTSRTHQASASLRLRATPAATRVSSTARSGILRRVITGRLKVVKIRVSSPQLAPHATLRRKRRSASRAILTRSSRVSSRNRSILATRAASRASGAVPAASSTSGRTPSTRISSPSEVTSGGPANHAVGTRLANQAPMPSAMDYIITPRPPGTQGGHDGRVMNRPALAAFALGLGLAGDVFLMLPDALLLAGIGAFLAGHLAYAVGFRFAGFSAAGLVAGGIIAAATAGLLLRRVLNALRASGRARLQNPVLAYAIVISLMTVSATASGNLVAAAGGLLFFLSAVIFAWCRFVKPVRWVEPVNIVMYQAGQALLVLGLAVGG